MKPETKQEKKYACISQQGDVAIYKSTTMSRIYRMPYPGNHKGVRLLTYKKEKNALEVCDYTEKIGNGVFKPKLVNI